MSFRPGFLSHLHGETPPAALYRDYVELFVAAEELGFDSGWVAHGYMRTGRAAAPYMIENGWGRIINISGLAARSGAPA